MTADDLSRVTVYGRCNNCVDRSSDYLSGRYLDGQMSMYMDADGGTGDAGGGGDEVLADNSKANHVVEAAKAFESFEPPCQAAGESNSAYVARTLAECVNHVKERITVVPWLTSKVAVATEACKPGIAGWNVSATLQDNLCKG